jgi:hypothetical protein
VAARRSSTTPREASRAGRGGNGDVEPEGRPCDASGEAGGRARDLQAICVAIDRARAGRSAFEERRPPVVRRRPEEEP